MGYILIVDDDTRIASSTAELLQRLLEHEPRIVEAHAYEDALRELRRPGLEALLTDHSLGPGPTGIDLLRAARALHPEASLVLMSADICPSVSSGALAAGADALLAKPFRPVELATALFGRGQEAPSGGNEARGAAIARPL